MPSEPPAGRGSPTETARLVLDLALAREPSLGAGRLVCIDGPAGSGKTTLARAVLDLAPGPARLVHMDDLYEGWSGLPHVSHRLGALLRPLALGRPGSYRRYDWGRGELAETVTVAPTALLVVEGVGSGAAELATLVTVLVWVHAPRALRRARGLARDGAGVAPYWDAWTSDEDLLFATQRTAERADVVVDGTGAAAPHVRTR